MITIATSLAPNNVEVQKAAIKSWKILGFDVVSLNSPEEIEKAELLFDDIKFVTMERNAKPKYGKPYIYFDDVLAYFKQNKNRICGIVNSDICLYNSDLKVFIEKEALNSLVYGSRVDVDSLDNLNGPFLEVGYDYFFFDRNIISCYPPEEFCLGQPWWDWWAVLNPAAKGYPIKKIMNPFAFHVKHTLRWNDDNWITLGHVMNKYFPTNIPMSAGTITQYGFSLYDYINDHTKFIFKTKADQYYPSILIVYNAKYGDPEESATYPSIKKQTYRNCSVCIGEFEKLDFKSVQEEFICFVDEGYILNKSFVEVLLLSIGDEDFASCGLRRLRKDGTDFFTKMFPVHNLEGKIKVNLDIKSCNIYRVKSFIKKDFFDGSLEDKKLKFIGMGLVETSINRFIQEQLADKMDQKIYIYGAGGHTRHLIENVDLNPYRICGIIDKNAALDGQKLCGYNILSINRLDEIDYDYILISSYSYEKGIFDELRKKIRPDKLIRIYYKDDPL